MTQLYLVRHTAVGIDGGICYGQSNVPLAVGYQDALGELRMRLRKVFFDACYTSPLERCRVLATDLYGPDIVVDERLAEINFGSWEMLHWSSIDRGQLDVWAKSFDVERPPGGESFLDLQHRAVAFLNDPRLQDCEHVLVVTHAGVIRTLLAYARGVPLKDAFSSFKPDYGSVSMIVLNDGTVSVYE